MLNRVILMGRITHDLEIRQTQSGTPTLRFMVAVDRYSKTEEKQADFITCVAWGQRAEFIAKYFGKGRMIAIEGNIKTGSYEDKNGVKHYTTDVYVDNASFTGEPKQESGSYSNNYGNGGYQQSASNNSQQSIGNLADFEEVLSDDGVPF
jgi:single-strand DNA-binding protein